MASNDRWDKYPWNKNPWGKHRQAVWRERALTEPPPRLLEDATQAERAARQKQPSYPAWLRIGMLALGAHRKDGCARFEKGELKQLLGIERDSHLANEIRKAKDYGWLDLASDATCLIVPSHAVAGGM